LFCPPRLLSPTPFLFSVFIMPLCSVCASVAAPLALSQPENLLLDKEGFLKVGLSHAAAHSRAELRARAIVWQA